MFSRRSPRKPRAFTPIQEALEAVCPVSSLMLLPFPASSVSAADFSIGPDEIDSDDDGVDPGRVRFSSPSSISYPSDDQANIHLRSVPIRNASESLVRDTEVTEEQDYIRDSLVLDSMGDLPLIDVPESSSLLNALTGAAQPFGVGSGGSIQVSASGQLGNNTTSQRDVQGNDDGIRPMTLAPARFSSPEKLSMMSGGDPSGCGCSSPEDPEIFVTFSGGVEDGAPVWDNGEEKFYDVIGNRVTVRVDSTEPLASVTWVVSGGVKNYTMTVDEAKVTPFSEFEYNSQMVIGEKRTFEFMFPSFDELSVIWDQAGTFTITANVTFMNDEDFDGQSDSVSVTVEEPSVKFMTNQQMPLRLLSWYENPPGNAYIGLYHGARNPIIPGNTFSAKVDAVPNLLNKSGEFAFLQTVENWEVVIELENGTKPINVNVNDKTLLDDYAGIGGPYFIKGFISQSYAPGVKNIELPDTPNLVISDSPKVRAKWEGQYPDANGGYEEQFTLKAKFTTYLMFKPDAPNGHWISIAGLPWEIDGVATYIGPKNGDIEDYVNIPQNWNVAISKPTAPEPPEGFPKTLIGVSNVKFLEWSGKVHDYQLEAD